MAPRYSSLKSAAIIFTVYSSELRLRLKFCCRPQRQFGLGDLAAMTAFFHPTSKPIEVKINDRRGIKSEELREQQPADDGNPHWPAQLAARPGFKCERQSPQQRCRCGHHDRSEAQQARLVNRFLR